MLTMALFAFGLAGCSPPWVVVMQTTPDPFVNAPRFSVLPTDFTGLQITTEMFANLNDESEPEAVFLSKKTVEEQHYFAANKAAINEEFVKQLVMLTHNADIDVVLGTGPADAPFQIHPSIKRIRHGIDGMLGYQTEVRMTLRITTPDGRVLDEIAMTHGSLYSGDGHAMAFVRGANPSESRLRGDGKWLANYATRYLKTRVHPDK
ncbi:MAG: hypothetical protein ABJE95_11990 [Byssovorax sp.]